MERGGARRVRASGRVRLLLQRLCDFKPSRTTPTFSGTKYLISVSYHFGRMKTVEYTKTDKRVCLLLASKRSAIESVQK